MDAFVLLVVIAVGLLDCIGELLVVGADTIVFRWDLNVYTYYRLSLLVR